MGVGGDLGAAHEKESNLKENLLILKCHPSNYSHYTSPRAASQWKYPALLQTAPYIHCSNTHVRTQTRTVKPDFRLWLSPAEVPPWSKYLLQRCKVFLKEDQNGSVYKRREFFICAGATRKKQFNKNMYGLWKQTQSKRRAHVGKDDISAPHAFSWRSFRCLQWTSPSFLLGLANPYCKTFAGNK